MHPQLQIIADELNSARDRLRHLASSLPDDLWAQRPEPTRWSVAECIAHLNLTSTAFLPLLRSALEEARSLDMPAPPRYRRGLIGWLLWRSMGPPVRLRTRAAAPFVPTGTSQPEQLISEFERLQEEQARSVTDAEGLPIDRVQINSPFDERVKYNLFTALSILPRHQHRHLWQAEQVAQQIRTAT